MTSKNLFEEKFLNSQDLYFKNLEGSMSLEYYLVEGIYKEEDNSMKEYKTFGIEIVKKENGSKVETKAVEHISLKRENVEKLLANLANNTVTPVSLHNVLDNLIGIQY